jgi:hypothetical protein
MYIAGESSLWDMAVARIVFAFNSRDLGVPRMIYMGGGVPNQPPMVVEMFEESVQICS